MQDIEGCRVIVDSMVEQDALAVRLQAAFDDVTVHDRRIDPSNGYRALHLVPRVMGERYEIQMRTRLQHAWAEVVERLAGRYGQELKYGSGEESLRSVPSDLSMIIARIESAEFLVFATMTGRKLTNDEQEVIVQNFEPDDQTTMLRAIQVDFYDSNVRHDLYRRVLQGRHGDLERIHGCRQR
jgi:ppGpp synthetase/RelA/SpoT-type nucleotidyltranferase